MFKRVTIVAVALLFVAGAAHAKRTITVRGQGSSSFTPKTARFYLNAKTTNGSNSQSSSLNAQTVRQVKTKLQQLGLKASQIRLGSAYSRPNFQRDGNGRSTQQVESWTTTQQVTVKLPFKSANNLVGKVYGSSTGFNNVSISGPSAEVSPSAVKAAGARARSRAVSNAVTEAKGQLKASGVARLGKLLTVAPTDQGGYSSRGMMLESVSARSAAPVMPEFTSPDKQTVNQTINATFAIKGPGLMARLRGMVGRK
jgi:uncharacterized protein YggE